METVMKIIIWWILKDPPHEDCAQTRTVPRTRWGWPWSRAPCPWCQYSIFNIWVDLSMMSMSPHWASKGIPASLVRCQAASMLVRLTGRKKHEFQGYVCTCYVPRKCLHCKLCTCYIPIDRGGSQEPNMEECSSVQLLLYIGRQPGGWWWWIWWSSVDWETNYLLDDSNDFDEESSLYWETPTCSGFGPRKK